MRGCKDSPPDQLVEGLRQFNDGEYFACHETLEALWLAEKGPVREVYQGILQVAVGLYHRQRGNYTGAVSLLRSGIRRLMQAPHTCQGIDMAQLAQQATTCLAEVERLGVARMAELDARFVPKVRLIGSAGA